MFAQNLDPLQGLEQVLVARMATANADRVESSTMWNAHMEVLVCLLGRQN